MRAEVKTTGALGIGDIGEMVQTNSSAADVIQCTAATEESETVGVVILDTEHNRQLLAEYNSVGSYKSLTRNTAKFEAAQRIDIAPLLAGMVLNLKLKASETPAMFTKIVSAGSGAIKKHPDDLAVALNAAGSQTVEVTTAVSGYRPGITIGKSLAKVTTVAAVQQMPVLVGA